MAASENGHGPIRNEDDVRRHLLAERQRLLAELTVVECGLIGLGIGADTHSEEDAEVKPKSALAKRGRGRPSDTSLNDIVQAVVYLTATHRRAASLPAVAAHIGTGRSQQQICNVLHKEGWQWERLRDQIAGWYGIAPRTR